MTKSDPATVTIGNASGQFTIDTSADRIESPQWLDEFIDRYSAAWNSGSADAVAACATEDVLWREPSMGRPVRNRDGLADFVADTLRTFPDISYTNPFPPTIAGESNIAVVPWRMTGTHLGVIDPPGFAGTGKRIDLFVVDVWQFRSGLIARCRSTWDLAEMLQQLGIMPPRGSAAERALAQAQRWRSKLGI
ncbi:ester cyclase [Nocardia sp. NPDC052566]|uniref:ester cyclase n=1 Tax=Nocardia sp. NPDC052566 TaxID=3364330 RepID=UPI0037CAC96D